MPRKTRKFYTFPQAQQVAQSMRIEGWQDYRRRYREDHFLPSDPATIYSSDWQGSEQLKKNLGKSTDY